MYCIFACSHVVVTGLEGFASNCGAHVFLWSLPNTNQEAVVCQTYSVCGSLQSAMWLHFPDVNYRFNLGADVGSLIIGSSMFRCKNTGFLHELGSTVHENCNATLSYDLISPTDSSCGPEQLKNGPT